MAETSVATKALTPIEEVRSAILKMEPQFERALPKHISVEKFGRVVMTAIQNEPKLLEANRQTLYSACMNAAQEGLLPDKREGAIVVYAGNAKWMPMIAGICKKARNSGEIKTINAAVVYDKDEYSAWTDETGEHFKHVKAKGERGLPVLTYAYAVTKDGGFYFEEIVESDMLKIEGSSKSGGAIWKGPFRDEMKRKSAIRRLAKYRLPSSTDLDGIIRSEDDLYDMKDEKPVQEAKTTSSRLEKIIETTAEPTVPNVPEAEVSELNDEEIPI